MLEGQPMISIIGLGDLAVKEAAERIQAAIDESGYAFPKKRVIISLAPCTRTQGQTLARKNKKKKQQIKVL